MIRVKTQIEWTYSKRENCLSFCVISLCYNFQSRDWTMRHGHLGCSSSKIYKCARTDSATKPSEHIFCAFDTIFIRKNSGHRLYRLMTTPVVGFLIRYITKITKLCERIASFLPFSCTDFVFSMDLGTMALPLDYTPLPLLPLCGKFNHFNGHRTSICSLFG